MPVVVITVPARLRTSHSGRTAECPHRDCLHTRPFPSLMWERTLQDLIRGLRANKKDDAKFIAQAVDEIRQEIRSKDMELKAGAVLKLTYVRPTLSRKLRASNAIMKS